MINIYMTNVYGLGAKRLCMALVDAFKTLRSDLFFHLPDDSSFVETASDSPYKVRKRFLPNSLSRFFETVFPSFFDGPVYNFTDIPLRTKSWQLLFVHNPHVFNDGKYSNFKYLVIKYLIKFNLKFVNVVVVQTEAMKSRFLDAFSFPPDLIFVVKQPSPLSFDFIPTREKCSKSSYKFLYPAFPYPHKNHYLLSHIPMSFFNAGNKIYLTCDASDCNYLPSDLFSFVGQLDLESLQSLYFECDVLLFPSGDESYGLPLIEAMKLGLPIIAPSLPYVHTLCSSYPYYFSDSDPSSFIDTLDFFCRSNPPVVIDYSSMLEDVPSSWSQVCLILLDKYNI